jgi:glycogen(starch) synthase
MNVLMSSYLFPPSVGGIETVSWILAHELTRYGARVTVVTRSGSTERDSTPFEIIRRPRPARLIELLRRCDVYFQNNISLNLAWPLALVRRPWVVALHTWVTRCNGEQSWQDRLKQRCLRSASCISVSRAVANHIDVPSTIIGNPYDDTQFVQMPEVSRTRDVVFLGRLVSDKGADLLISALAQLRSRGLHPTVTIIGTGPDEQLLRALAEQEGVSHQIQFAGLKKGLELVRTLNEHRIMVVPSRWQEPFGVVALEGIACGCVILGAASGGLPDAIGPCGTTFRIGDAEDLAKKLEHLLENSELIPSFQAHARRHLAHHKPCVIAARYFDVISKAAEGRICITKSRSLA